MLVDAAFRSTFREFSTLFLLVAVMTVPMHVAHSYVFRDVLAVRDLHPDIRDFPEGRRVRDVGVADLHRSQQAWLALTLLEIALIPVVVRAARPVVRGELQPATVLGAYRRVARRRPRGKERPRQLAWTLVGLAVAALLVTALLRASGLVVVAALPDDHAFPWIGLVEGTARALGGALFVGPAAFLTAPPDT
jgi:hypothetical protein